MLNEVKRIGGLFEGAFAPSSGIILQEFRKPIPLTPFPSKINEGKGE
jgi:hypothetical protein